MTARAAAPPPAAATMATTRPNAPLRSPLHGIPPAAGSAPPAPAMPPGAAGQREQPPIPAQGRAQPAPPGRAGGEGQNTKNTDNMKENTKKDTWRFVLQLLLSVLSAVCTTLGVSSCM